jgi:hypothetical protein
MPGLFCWFKGIAAMRLTIHGKNEKICDNSMHKRGLMVARAASGLLV